jgi:hypothetical protein
MQAMFGPEVALRAYAVQRALNNGSSGCP